MAPLQIQGAPNDITSTRWQRLYPGYFGFSVVQWKWRCDSHLYLSQRSVHVKSFLKHLVLCTWILLLPIHSRFHPPYAQVIGPRQVRFPPAGTSRMVLVSTLHHSYKTSDLFSSAELDCQHADLQTPLRRNSQGDLSKWSVS